LGKPFCPRCDSKGVEQFSFSVPSATSSMVRSKWHVEIIRSSSEAGLKLCVYVPRPKGPHTRRVEPRPHRGSGPRDVET
jgi:hypothetical protein